MDRLAVLRVIQHGKEEYERLMPGTVQLCAIVGSIEGSIDMYVHRNRVS